MSRPSVKSTKETKLLQAQIDELKYYRDNEVKDPNAKEIINKRIIEINKEQLKLGTWNFGTNIVINPKKGEKYDSEIK